MDDILADNVTDLARFQLIEIGSACQDIFYVVAARCVGRMQLGPIIPIKAVRTQKRFQIAPQVPAETNIW
ncbi:hypothetical protein [Mesorhizobium sp.]|uniref:hypothetical protein n=1 Tax=Mesorhizobium sp. TaxID=1871066 RepID=UPI0025D86271|nr:hypothetical protein [Mesorhizobium sp.]